MHATRDAKIWKHNIILIEEKERGERAQVRLDFSRSPVFVMGARKGRL